MRGLWSNTAKLSNKCYVSGVLYRLSLDEVRAYYSREGVLDEILGAMRRWHDIKTLRSSF